MIRYILFDKDSAKTKVWQKRLGERHPIQVTTASVDNIPADIYISPANGHGQLDGGIDKVYRTMFPGLQTIVNEILKEYKDRKPPVGVGSGILIDIPNRKTKLLLAPTMDLPTKLKTPWNSFWSALMIFYLTRDMMNVMPLTIAIPGLGTGTGHLEADEMIDMVKLAWTISQTHPLEEVYRDFRYEYVPGVKLVLSESLHERPISQRLRQMVQN